MESVEDHMKATVSKLQNQEKDAELRIEELETQVPFWFVSQNVVRGRVAVLVACVHAGDRSAAAAAAGLSPWRRARFVSTMRAPGHENPRGSGAAVVVCGALGVVLVVAVVIDAVAGAQSRWARCAWTRWPWSTEPDGDSASLPHTRSQPPRTTDSGGAGTHASFANTAVARRGRAARPGLRRDAPRAPIDGDEVISNVEVSLEQRITSLEGDMERNIVDHASDVEKTLNAKISESVEVAVDSLGNGWKYPFFLLVIIDGVVGYVVYSWYFKFKKSHLL
jgi:hypothetical protein